MTTRKAGDLVVVKADPSCTYLSGARAKIIRVAGPDWLFIQLTFPRLDYRGTKPETAAGLFLVPAELVEDAR